MELHGACSILALFLITLPAFAIPPVPKLHFEDKIIEDVNTVISCSFNNTNYIDVNLEIKSNATTLKNCQQKTVTETKQVSSTKKTCTVEVTRSMHKMEFICEAYLKTQSKPEKMYLQTEPEFTDCPDTLVWIEQKENSFHCKATGYPHPNVTCQKGDAKYLEGVKYKTFRYMTGTYSCIAINFDKDSRDVEVTVQYKPEVLNITMTPPLHNYGDDVTMTCEADGVPAPTYCWITASSDVHFSPDNKTITVHNMKSSHLGKYQCVASNKHGNHSREEELSREAQPTISELEVEPSTNVLQGDNLTLSCQASGFPAPTLHWIYPNAEVEISPNKSTLQIWNAKKENMGNYSCTARNKHGSAIKSWKITLEGEKNGGDRMESSITTMFTVLITISLMFCLS
ncbi:intercellular adhesion molecule 5-like [Eleutherodactylus coqui]|uniref:Ig-like domain-containing protein n=1 Tax=Eleutherodactylus coqui TaxID=57060 RepID=A0A8J6FKR1_ELECQ|nr:hypothetical protein GDO78_004830 [Eleutherodactylus coqui]